MNVLNVIKSKSIWIICILSFLTAFSYNQTNLKHIPKEQVREHQTVITNDDISYLRPAKNYIENGNWKANSPGIQSYFIRTPGYGIFYMMCLKLSNASSALIFLKIIQHLLFAISVYWFYSTTHSLINNKTIAFISASIYGLTPIAIGFLSYTLTEGVTPALLLLYVFLLFKGYKKGSNHQKNTHYFLAALAFSSLLIIRPQLGFIGILLPIFLFKSFYKEGILKLVMKLVLFGSIAFSFMLIWQYRNYNITNKFVGLHSIYYADNNSIYRPTFKELWNLTGGWAQEGHVTHSYMVPMWSAAIKGDTAEHYVQAAINTFPKEVVDHFGEARLSTVFKGYQKATFHQKYYYDQELPMPNEIPKVELEVIEDFKQLTKEYKSNFWFQYHILSPLKVFKVMAFHSNLSLYMFQHTYRGNWSMELLRFLSFGLHSISFIALLIGLLLFKSNNWRMNTLWITTFIYVFYLCYFQRGIEERYTLPVLPILIIGVTVLLNQLRIRLRR